jgi:cytochrome c biogenesis protein CcdA
VSSSELFYAFTLGMLAAVNPCGFPLLPAYLEMFTGDTGSSRLANQTGRAVAAGGLATIGFVALFGAFGLAIEVGWSALAGHAVSGARFVMAGVGIAMAVAGVASLVHRPLRVPLPVLPSGIGLRRPAAMAVFGLSYGVASLGCALPLFVSGVATTFTGDSPASGVAVFVAYAIGMGSVLSALAVGIAIAGPAAARPLRRFSRLVAPLGGVLLLCVGAYLAWYWISAITDPLASNPVERVVNTVQAHVASFIQTEATVVGAVIGVLVVLSVLFAGLADVRTPWRVWRTASDPRRDGESPSPAALPPILTQYQDTPL